MKMKKLLAAAIPLLVGAVIYGSLNKLSSTKGPSSGMASSSASSGPPLDMPPTDALHEKLALEETLKKNPNHTPILLRLSELARERGETAEATRYLKELVAAEPGNVEARLELGKILYETNDVQGAIDETGKILEHNPKHTDAMYNLGAIYGNINRNDMAKKYWEMAMATEPTSEGARKAANALKELGK